MGSTTEFYQANPNVAMVEMQRLVRVIGEQADAERAAYERGWAECGEAMAKYAADMWESAYDAGWADAEADMDNVWKSVARYIRVGAEKAFPTWEQKRAMELENCKPKPGDFSGLENDSTCLERMKVTK